MAELSKEQLVRALSDAVESGDIEKATVIDEYIRKSEERARLSNTDRDSYKFDKYGAPTAVRAAVGNAPNLQDKLATLKQWYPDARAIDDGDNFSYTDEEGNIVKYNDDRGWFNEPLQDLAEYSRVPFEMLGAAAGGIAGIPGGLPGMMVGAGGGGAAGGMAYDAIASNLLGTVNTNSPYENLKKTMTDAAFNSVFPGNPTSPNVPMIPKAKPATAIQSTADMLGVPTTMGQRTGNELLRSAEGAIEGTVAGAQPLHNVHRGLISGVEDLLDSSKGKVFPSPIKGGDKIQKATSKHFKKARAYQGELFKALDSTFDDQGNSVMSGIDAENLLDLVKGREELVSDADEFGGLLYKTELDDLVTKLEAAKSGGKPPYEVVKQYRTLMMERMKNPMTTNMSEGAVKRIVAAASKDLDEGAVQLGGAAGKKARDKANIFTRDLKGREEIVNKKVGVQLDPEQAFKNVENAFMNSPTKFGKIMATLPKKDKRDVMKTMLYRMSRATPGRQNAVGNELSLQTFKTNMAKVMKNSPESLDFLDKSQRNALKHMLVVADDMAEFEKGVNWSRTGRVNNLLDIVKGTKEGALGGGGLAGLTTGDPVSAVVGGVLGGVGELAIPWVMSKAMTNQKFAKALTSMTTKEIHAVISSAAKASANETELYQYLEENMP